MTTMTSVTTPETCVAVDQTPTTTEHTTSAPLDNITHDHDPTPVPVADATPGGNVPPPTVTEDHQDHDSEEVTSSLERDHPSFSKATISVIIQLLPEDGHVEGRLALIAVKSHNLAPLMTMQRLGTLGPFPSPVTMLLQQWDTALPEALSQRALARAQEQEVQRLKEVERKAQRATTKRPDIKKTEKPRPTHTRTDTLTPTAETAPTSPVPTASQPDLF
jgi:hypothetical protein